MGRIGWFQGRSSVARRLARTENGDSGLSLDDGSRVAVVGGGPAGSFFSYFLLQMAESIGTALSVDIFEPRHFTHCGPAGCNHCGGIISESLVQHLATEGIVLPSTIVQRAIDSYVLHMDAGTVQIETPLHEKRIAAVFRGGGPRDEMSVTPSFDGHLQGLAVDRGARIVRKLVTDITWEDGRPRIHHADGAGDTYDLVALAVGVNSRLLERVPGSTVPYRSPATAMTYICEFRVDRDTIERTLGTSMHVFLLDIPRLEFAALIPKGDIITLVLLGTRIDQALVTSFLGTPEVRSTLPPGVDFDARVCNCTPFINVRGAAPPWADRLVALGDSGVTRLYKDGIGAAYRTAKAAAVTSVFHGVAARDFERHFGPTCRAISRDNAIGKFIFAFNETLQRTAVSRRAILRMTTREQLLAGRSRHMSQVLWDLFSGSAPYREILMHTLHPGFVANLVWSLGCAVATPRPPRVARKAS